MSVATNVYGMFCVGAYNVCVQLVENFTMWLFHKTFHKKLLGMLLNFLTHKRIKKALNNNLSPQDLCESLNRYAVLSTGGTERVLSYLAVVSGLPSKQVQLK